MEAPFSPAGEDGALYLVIIDIVGRYVRLYANAVRADNELTGYAHCLHSELCPAHYVEAGERLGLFKSFG